MFHRPPRARAAAGVVLAALGLALLTAGLLAGCSSGADTSAPTVHEVTALLSRHGRAVIAHDRTGFLADVDDSPAATAFWRGQAAEFANLTRLPIERWTYRVDARTGDRGAEAAAGKRLGAAAIVVKIDLAYALARADTVPSTRSLWWTFVRRDGHVVVSGDAALADAGGVSWRGPWDFGALTIVSGRYSLVLGHDDPSVLRPVADEVDAAVPAVSKIWTGSWPRYVVVVVPGSEEELAATVGESSTITSAVAAAAISDNADPVTGAVPGQRLVVNPDALDGLSAVGRRIVVRHEVTHIADARATTDATPVWVREGFAEYVANLATGQPVPVAAAELRAEMVAGRQPAQLPGPADFATGTTIGAAYQEAWLACRLIAAKAGTSGLVTFYRVVGQAVADPSPAEAGLRAVLHESLAAFTTQWRAYVRAELR